MYCAAVAARHGCASDFEEEGFSVESELSSRRVGCDMTTNTRYLCISLVAAHQMMSCEIWRLSMFTIYYSIDVWKVHVCMCVCAVLHERH